MNPHQGQTNKSDGADEAAAAALDISKLSLNNNGAASAAAATSGANANGSNSSALPVVAATPNLNILNQASNVTQLNANKTSFDPTQVVVTTAAAGVVAGGSGQQQTAGSSTLASALEPQQLQQQQQAMIPSFLIHPSQSNVPPVAASSQQPSSASALLMPNQLSSQITTQQQQPSSVVMQQNQQQPVIQLQQPTMVQSHATTATDPSALFQQNTTTALAHQNHAAAVPAVMASMSTSSIGAAPAASSSSGVVLFVGGLPNEVTDLSFLQFFQQYGEVIDSVVLLDRRTKRSRGFGFVTFADPNVAAALLTTIPGRTGVVNIHGKNCELKASEPKSAENAMAMNYPPSSSPHHYHHHHQNNNPHGGGWNQMPQQRMVFGAGGGGGARGAIHPLQVNQTMPVPPNFNYGGGVAADGSGAGAAGGVVPIYSHSTITRTTAGPDGTPSHEGGAQNVYIQNNFYTLPSGTELPNATMNPTPESLQAQQTEMIQNGGAISLGGQQPTPTATAGLSSGAMSAPQYTTPTYSATPSALQPLYPGPNGSETDAAITVGQLQQQQSQQQQHIAAIGHPTAYSAAGQR
ncbi:hypothetical protein ACHAXR_007325 [Thalassiosira sp. AJA248-18]